MSRSRRKPASKANAYYKQIKDDRNAWRDAQRRMCWVPRCGNSVSLEVHEICFKSQAPRRWGHRANYFIVCRDCHIPRLHGKDGFTIVEQLAIKFIMDPEHYDLTRWLMIGDPELRAPERITQVEVEEAARRIYGAIASRNERSGVWHGVE